MRKRDSRGAGLIATSALGTLMAGTIAYRGCTQGPEPVPAPTPTVVATASPTATPTASPTPVQSTPIPRTGPTPSMCPELVKLGASYLGEQFADQAGRPCQWVDLTPRFKGLGCPRADGCPCNAEHHEVCTFLGSQNPAMPYRRCEPEGNWLRITLGQGVLSTWGTHHIDGDNPRVYRGYQIGVCGKHNTPWLITADLAFGAMGGDGEAMHKAPSFTPTVLRGRFK